MLSDYFCVSHNPNHEYMLFKHHKILISIWLYQVICSWVQEFQGHYRIILISLVIMLIGYKVRTSTHIFLTQSSWAFKKKEYDNNNIRIISVN